MFVLIETRIFHRRVARRRICLAGIVIRRDIYMLRARIKSIILFYLGSRNARDMSRFIGSEVEIRRKQHDSLAFRLSSRRRSHCLFIVRDWHVTRVSNIRARFGGPASLDCPSAVVEISESAMRFDLIHLAATRSNLYARAERRARVFSLSLCIHINRITI